jgi:hypothetical protein
MRDSVIANLKQAARLLFSCKFTSYLDGNVALRSEGKAVAHLFNQNTRVTPSFAPLTR